MLDEHRRKIVPESLQSVAGAAKPQGPMRKSLPALILDQHSHVGNGTAGSTASYQSETSILRGFSGRRRLKPRQNRADCTFFAKKC
jgi:hypothetical protein